MRLRGRLTLTAVAAAAGLLLWHGAARDSSARVAPESPARMAARAPTRLVPATLLAMLPPTARAAAGTVPRAAVAPAIREWVEASPPEGRVRERFELEYTLDPDLSARVASILRRARVSLGHVVVLEPASGRVLAYASTDPERFPPGRAYPTASLIKVVTAAATLEHAPEWAERPCRYRGNPYRLTRARLDPPRRGRTVSLRRALAMSNNQCFAQLAVHALGADALLGEIERFGLLEPPAPGHAPGRVDVVADSLELGRLGSGLAGSRITPLGAARLAATLATGELVQPRWIAGVRDLEGRALAVPAPPDPRLVVAPAIASELRSMLVDTTERGTARRAFRGRSGRPLLAPIRVAGKTGSLTSRDPDGRYEWFIGLAPADHPRVAIATLVVHGDLWWRNASQIAADVLKAALCARGPCRREGA